MNRRLHTLLLPPPPAFISVPPHPIPTPCPQYSLCLLLPLNFLPEKTLLLLCARYNSLPFFQYFLTQIPSSFFVPLSCVGGLHRYYPHCTTGALLKSSHTLSLQKTSVGLKTFCEAHLMGQPGTSDLRVNSCSLLAVHPAVVTNSSIQNKSLMVIWRTEINSGILCSGLELSVT